MTRRAASRTTCLTMLAVQMALLAAPARAEDATAPAANPPAAPAANAMSTPAMVGPLAANPAPYTFDSDLTGKIYFTGAVTGLGLAQSHPLPTDRHSLLDLDNGQLFVQKTDGLVQFFVDAGAYTIPVIGQPYVRSDRYTDNTYNWVPQAWVKIAPTSSFSIQAGKLPTLFGSEDAYTFENMNIERGLLWNQENTVNRGIQANYTAGPLAFSLSWNDGFYSNRYNWLDGAVTWTINGSNTLEAVAGGSVKRSAFTDTAAPLAQNNSQIYDLEYTWTSGNWLATPYLQYTYVPSDAAIGLAQHASTWGAAALVKYSFTPEWSLSGRAEYEDTSGSAAAGAPNLLYGPGSNAWSFTLTPAWQHGLFFGRAEGSYIQAGHVTPGAAFGTLGNDKSQARGLFEIDVLF
jgi:hypothetical protein